MADPDTGIRTDDDGSFDGRAAAEWLVANGIVSDLDSASVAVLRLADFGELQRVTCPSQGPLPAPEILRGRYRAKMQPRNDEGMEQDSWVPRGWIVFLNPRSGGHRGRKLHREFLRLLPAEQVIDVTESGSLREGVLLWLRRRQDFDVLVCGGDGTIRWILETFEDVASPRRPVVAVVPLGVGNDLGKTLGWSHLRANTATRILQELETKGRPVPIDRWNVTAFRSQEGITSHTQSATMTNYLSIGLDAAGCRAFHRARERAPWLFPAVAVNKVWYSIITGAISFGRPFTELRNSVSVTVDGLRVTIPKKAAIVAVLNTPTIYGGVWAWGKSGGAKASDGILEVVSIRGAWHLGMMFAKITHGHRLGRGAVVTISCTGPMPMEIDGEPDSLPALSTVRIQKKGTATMLANSEKL